MTRQEKVEKAQALLREVQETLNIQQTICACCGRPSWVDWDQRNAYQSLKGTITRIERCLGDLRHKGIE